MDFLPASSEKLFKVALILTKSKMTQNRTFQMSFEIELKPLYTKKTVATANNAIPAKAAGLRYSTSV